MLRVFFIGNFITMRDTGDHCTKRGVNPLMVSLLSMPDDILKEHDLTQTLYVYAEALGGMRSAVLEYLKE